jgi:hypothetical protein
MISYTFQHGPRTFAAVLVIVVLSVADSYLTIDLVSCGGKELNPIMAYYLNQSPLLFFLVKYWLTCAAIVIILSIKNNYILGTKIRAGFLLVFFLFALALAAQWQLFLLYEIVD